MRNIYFFIGLFLCVSCTLSKDKDPSSNPFHAQIQFVDSIYDFGVLPISNPCTRHSFCFRNTGSDPVIILGAKPSCHCTSATYNHGLILPGQTDSIVVTFDATGDNPGVFHKSVLVRMNTVPDSHTLVMSGIVE